MLRNKFDNLHIGLALWAIWASMAFGADDAIPSALPSDRYAGMSAHCPFAVASPVVAPSQPQASFAANWFISGIGRINDDDFVTIKAKDLSTQFSLYGREADPQTGVALASVNWSEVVGKSTVVLRKGTETAMLEFNEAQIRNPPPVTGDNGKGSSKPQTATANAAVPAVPSNGAMAQHPPTSLSPNSAAVQKNGLGFAQPNSQPPRRRVLPIPGPR